MQAGCRPRRVLGCARQPAHGRAAQDFGLVDAALVPWFTRMPVLAHYRGFSMPAEHTRARPRRGCTSSSYLRARTQCCRPAASL
jgi:hypothetical protein